jgi:DNA repair exonuclease SbcCD nuclease subunit
LASLVQIGEIARARKDIAVLDGGDFIHVKTASRTSHALVVQVLKIHKEYPCTVWCVEGNHDVVGDNLDTVEQQPLGVLYESCFRHLRDVVFEGEGLRVRVVGIPYSAHRTIEEIQTIARKQPGDTHLIAVIHALAGENPPAHVEEFFGESVFRYQALVYEGGPDALLFGHWHKDQGIVRIRNRVFVNQGAVSRGALTNENINRVPKVAVLTVTTNGIEVEGVPLSVAPPEEVFDLERKTREDKQAVVINQFVKQIESELVSSADEDFSLSIEKLEFAPEVRVRALAYLDRARVA